MAKRTIDKTKSSNIKCEHCEHHDREPNSYNGKCKLTGKPKNYWHRCKRFKWRKNAAYKT